MPKQRPTGAEKQPRTHKPTPTFLLELPLQVTSGQAKRLRAHLEAARQLYNAILSEGQRLLLPRVPKRGMPLVGKVGSPACGQHTS